MKSETFWNWTEHATSGARLAMPNVALLDAAFERLADSEKAEIARSFHQVLDSADRLGLWQLCSLLSGQPCGDDSFSYFRRWLILQGKEVFTTVMANPDDLASFVRDGSVPKEPFVESIGMAEDSETGGERQEQACVMQPPPTRSWSWLQSSEERIRRDLPRVWRLIGHDFKWSTESDSAAEAQACEVPGLGLIRVGDRLQHKAGMGVGTVTAILIPETAAAELEFASGKKVFRLTPDFFERVS